jgi:hypothetical protein
MKFVRRICSVVLAVTLLLPLAPHSAAAATLSAEDRLTQMEQRITQLERALKASTIDVVGLVDKAAPSVVSLYLVDEENDVKSQGTGFIVDKAGLILTNAHVVQGDHTIQVKFSDGTALDRPGGAAAAAFRRHGQSDTAARTTSGKRGVPGHGGPSERTVLAGMGRSAAWHACSVSPVSVRAATLAQHP